MGVFEAFSMIARAKGEVCHEYINYLFDRKKLVHDIDNFVPYMVNRYQSDLPPEEIPFLLTRDIRTLISNIVAETDEIEFSDLLDFLIFKSKQEKEICMLKREEILIDDEDEDEDDEEEDDEEIESELERDIEYIEFIKKEVRKRLSTKYKTQDDFLESINSVTIETPISEIANIVAHDEDEYLKIVKSGYNGKEGIDEITTTSSYEEFWQISQDARTAELSLARWKARLITLSE